MSACNRCWSPLINGVCPGCKKGLPYTDPTRGTMQPPPAPRRKKRGAK